MAVLPEQKTFDKTFKTMSKVRFLQLFLVLCCCICVRSHPEDPLITYDMLYQSGVSSYTNERWSECVAYMLSALEDYKFYHDNLATCRLNCQNITSIKTDNPHLIDLQFFRYSLRNSDCMRRCKHLVFDGRPESVSKKVNNDFSNLKPYNYLQICAYKMKDYSVAMGAAYTFMLANPDDEVMERNIKYYQKMPQAKPEYFRDMEIRDYQENYDQGIDAYFSRDYETAVPLLEQALTQFYEASRRCQVLCEGPYDHESLPDFYNAIADHYISVLECQQACEAKLSRLNGKHIDDYLPEHYNYLQFAYYQSEEIKKAAHCAGTYLMFLPDDESMLDNVKYYRTLGVSKDWFTPRQEAQQYYDRIKQIGEQLAFVTESYQRATADVDQKSEDDGVRHDKDEVEKEEAQIISEANMKKFIQSKLVHPGLKAWFRKADSALHMVLSRKQMKMVTQDVESGKRLAADGFLDSEECHSLMSLAQHVDVKAVDSSSADKKTAYGGMTIMQALQLAKDSAVNKHQVELYVKISQALNEFFKEFYYKPELHQHTVQLACRTPAKDITQTQDLSGSQSDCVDQEDGHCVSDQTVPQDNEYRVVLYLNEEFKGGNFVFINKNKTEEGVVQPRCGRLVSFQSNDLHKVRDVTQGRRCALVMSLSQTGEKMDLTHKSALKTLSALPDPARGHLAPTILDLEKANGYKVIKTEVDLNGPMRFAADNMMTSEECQLLMNLANVGGLHGDGYKDKRGKSRISPHTHYEMFEGLTVMRAAELAYSTKVNKDAVSLYLKMSEKSRHLVEKYFNLDRPLYFDYTHLVCRTALDEDKIDRKDLSHPIHSDNCMIQPDGSCLKERPAYIERDFSALLYLNGDFTGGDFFFAHTNKSVQSQVRPRCGRMVGFNSTNYHGVKAVLSGQRCAVAMWFTLDVNYRELAHDLAHHLLNSIHTKSTSSRTHGEL